MMMGPSIIMAAVLEPFVFPFYAVAKALGEMVGWHRAKRMEDHPGWRISRRPGRYLGDVEYRLWREGEMRARIESHEDSRRVTLYVRRFGKDDPESWKMLPCLEDAIDVVVIGHVDDLFTGRS